MGWIISSGLNGLGPFQLVKSLHKGYVYIRPNRLMIGLSNEINHFVIWRFALSNVAELIQFLYCSFIILQFLLFSISISNFIYNSANTNPKISYQSENQKIRKSNNPIISLLGLI
jgi:hypothetical protein